MPAEQRRLVIRVDDVVCLRRTVGPLAWVLLEVLASNSEPGAGSTRVRYSSRSLAEEVGVSKDSVARALRVLTEAGVVFRVDHRDELSGRFVATSYAVDLQAAGLEVVAVSQDGDPVPPEQAEPPVASVPSGHPDRPGRHVGPGPSDQLSLLT